MVFRARPKRQFGSVHPNRARLTRHPTRYTAACLPADLFGRGAQKREDVTGSLAITAPLAIVIAIAAADPASSPIGRKLSSWAKYLRHDPGRHTGHADTERGR